MRFRPFFASIIACVLPFSAHAETLKLLNWEAYLAPSVIDQWQAETGIKIEQIYFDSDERRDAMLVDAKRHGIDLAIVDETASRLFGKRGIIFAPTPEQAPTLNNLVPRFREQCGRYSVPYMWGTLGIAYRTDKVSPAPTGWSALIDPAPYLKGHIGMMDDITDMLAPALFLQQQSLNTEDQKVLKSTFNLLKAQVPSVLTYDYAITYLQSNSKAKQLYMALVYSGDQHVLNEVSGNKHWQYVVPREGTVLWEDCITAISGSKHRDAAIRFIDFLNRPDVAARNAQALWVATPNAAAMKLLKADFRKDQEVFPSPEIMAKSQRYRPLSNAGQLLRKRITSAIIKLHDAQ